MTLHVFPQLNPFKGKLAHVYELSADVTESYKGRVFKIPAGFQYDGASVPSALYQLIGTPFNPQFMRAAAFHDWLYHTHQLKRKEADKMLCDLLEQDGVGSGKSFLIYQAVRLAGSLFYPNDQEDLAYMNALRNAILARGQIPADYGL